MPKEKESEIVFLRETMEQNEQVIFRVYEEKEKMWERELKKMKNLYEARLKANQQKASKMEAVLLNQTYQVKNYGIAYIHSWKIESSFVISVYSLPSRHGKKGGLPPSPPP
jgi:hypothetical protein